MASTAPVFPSAKESANYARLCRLLLDVGSRVLRETFDRLCPPGALGTVLGNHPVQTKLQSLRRKRILNPSQWGKLYPAMKSSVSSKNFDITLLTVLLRNICGLTPPTTGWDNCPLTTDLTLQADIARVKFYRNTVYGHASQAAVNDVLFSAYWKEIRDTLVRLGGASYRAAIDALEHEYWDPEMEGHYQELLKQWKMDEVSIEDKLDEIGRMLNELKASLDDFKREPVMVTTPTEQSPVLDGKSADTRSSRVESQLSTGHAPGSIVGNMATTADGGQDVPSEINLRGRLALEAYNKALTKGKAFAKRVPIMLIGQDCSGKTSLKNSLLGKPFNPDEDSTVGIDVDPSHFKVSTEIWKAGKSAENAQASDAIEAMSFEHHAARLVAEHLKEEKRNSLDVGSVVFITVGSFDVSNAKCEGLLFSPTSDTSSDTTESIDDGKRVPDTSSDPALKNEERPPLASPKIPDEVATLIQKILQEVEKVPVEDDVYSVLWDFGGQTVYYATHPLFVTAKAMYLLVYDLSRNPHERAKPAVKQGMYKKILDNNGAKINLDYLNFWMTSVASLGCPDLPGVNIPPVFLVCTHADKPYDEADPMALAREVFGSLQTEAYKYQLYDDVFVVDNTKSGVESECSEVQRLREKVLDVAKNLPQMKEAIPIKWLKYEKTLQVTVKEGHKWISLEVAKQIASEVCTIDDEQEFVTLLNFLHDQRILIHFDDTPVLNDLIVLDLQWLVDIFKKVITVKPYDQEERVFKDLWRRLELTGILDEKLLEHVWGPLLDDRETSASLLEIMEKFSLLCPWPSNDASRGRQYLVPSMLMSHPPQNIIELVASARIPSFFLKFKSGHVLPGLFPRLVLQIFQWGQNKFWSSQNPKLYHNFARFYTSGDEDCSVILLCHTSSIEVVVHRGNLSADLTERFQSKLNVSEDTHYDAFEVTCVRAVHRQLGLMLECMRKEFPWLRNMKYEVGVVCPVCCQGRLVKNCDTHHGERCEQEECLHFWSESVLRSAKQFCRCFKCATAKVNKFHVKQIAPWIETSGEQLTIVERDGRLLTPEEENEEKLLALPSKDLESLLSKPCDSKEVVLQLTHCLPLDQDSLKDPDPGTKRLIRCLARKAKRLKRLDVFDHLREVTQAGSTGPRLPECLDIRRIPFHQMRALTVRLSGGVEWKIVAEELGLNSDEIRYLDNRTQNPCEALLAYISQHCYKSVGYLYNILNKCEFPVAADIL